MHDLSSGSRGAVAALHHQTIDPTVMRVHVAPPEQALQLPKGFAANPLAKQPGGGSSADDKVQGFGCLFPRSRTVTAEEEAASDDWDPRWHLRRATRRKR